MPFSGTLRAVSLALKSLMLHKLRSGLTMLGIVFGVFSVIAMLSIGEGASAQARKQVLDLGATNVIVRTVKPPAEVAGGEGSSRVITYGLTRRDYALLAAVPTVVRAVPIREAAQEMRHLADAMNGRLVGVTGDYLDLNNLSLSRGRFISDGDQRTAENVCVISAGVRDELFGLEDPIGKAVRIGENYYAVVGVMKDRQASAAIGGSLSAQEFDKDIYIPIGTFRSRIGDFIVQRMAGGSSYESVELNQVTLQVADADDVLPTAEVARETLDATHGGKKDFTVVVPLELLKQAEQIRDIFNVVLGSIAAISLVVGGIGIMNIMLATVTERTREIGIRRALGAKQSDILKQFLTETVVLSGAGGLIGVGLGLLTPAAFAGMQWVVKNFVLEGGSPGEGGGELGGMFADMEPQLAVWSLPVSFLISVGIGILFGVYPARSAARLDPIEALRHE